MASFLAENFAIDSLRASWRSDPGLAGSPETIYRTINYRLLTTPTHLTTPTMHDLSLRTYNIL